MAKCENGKDDNIAEVFETSEKSPFENAERICKALNQKTS